MDAQLIVTLSLIHAAALISPGPDFAIIIRLATLESRRVAIGAALGIALAIGIHTLLSLTGISLAIHNSAKLYAIVQMIGASYLGWMGFSALKAAFSSKEISENSSAHHDESKTKQAVNKPQREPLNLYQGLKIGLLTNRLNPKALVFFITLFSALITPSVTLATKWAVGIMLFSLSFFWFSLVSIMLSTPRIQQGFQRFSKLIDGFTGSLFLLVALAILYQLIFL